MDAMAAILDDLPDSTVLIVIAMDLSNDPDSWLNEIEHYLGTSMTSSRIEGTDVRNCPSVFGTLH